MDIEQFAVACKKARVQEIGRGSLVLKTRRTAKNLDYVYLGGNRFTPRGEVVEEFEGGTVIVIYDVEDVVTFMSKKFPEFKALMEGD